MTLYLGAYLQAFWLALALGTVAGVRAWRWVRAVGSAARGHWTGLEEQERAERAVLALMGAWVGGLLALVLS